MHVEVHAFQTQSQNYVKVDFTLRLLGKEALVHTDWLWTLQYQKKKNPIAPVGTSL
jgi:type IV secretory pathway component VirB8